MECLREDEDSVDLSVSNDFAAIWIQDNYFDIIKKSFYLAAGRPIEIRLKVIPKEENNIRVREKEPHYNNRIQSPLSDTEENDAHRIAHEKKKHRVSANYLLNPRNTFDNFIIGPGNQFGRAAGGKGQYEPDGLDRPRGRRLRNACGRMQQDERT